MQLVNVPFIAAWLLFSFSNQVWHVFCALAMTGASGGLLEAPVSFRFAASEIGKFQHLNLCYRS